MRKQQHAIISQVQAAGERTDELVWPLPLIRRYRDQPGLRSR
jgi:leucyl aminopeptidase